RIDTAQIGGCNDGTPDDMGDDRNHHFRTVAVERFSGKQPAEDWDAGETWDRGSGLCVLPAHQSGQQADFSGAHSYLVLRLPLPDDRFVDTSQRDVPVHAGDFQFHVHGDLAVIVYSRSDVHINANIDIGELRVDQRANGGCAGSGGITSSGGGLAVAELEGGLDVIDGAQLGRLEDARAGVAHH